MGGCTNCGSKSGCDHRKGEMLEAVDEALARLYPSRTWGVPRPPEPDRGADGDAAALADELAQDLDAAVFLRAGDAGEHCDFVYILCVGRPPCAIQVRDQGVPPPAEWDGDAVITESYLRVALSSLARMAVVQEVTVEVRGADDGWLVRELPRAGVYSAPLLRRFQRLVALLPAYDILHVDLGDISGPPPGYEPGEWPSLFAGTPAVTNYLFYPQPATMVTTTWLPAEGRERSELRGSTRDEGAERGARAGANKQR